MGLSRIVGFVEDLILHTFVLLFRAALAFGMVYVAAIILGWFVEIWPDPDFDPTSPGNLAFIPILKSRTLKAAFVVRPGLACAAAGYCIQSLTGKENLVTRFMRYIKRPEVWYPSVLVVYGFIAGMLCGVLWTMVVLLTIGLGLIFQASGLQEYT